MQADHETAVRDHRPAVVVPVVVLTGDGGLLMVLGELATAVEQGLPIIVICFVDHSLALIEVKQRERQLTRQGVAVGAFVYAREPRADGEPRVADGRVRALVSGETDAAGRFRLEPLAPGTYEVVVWYAAGFVAEAQDHRDARVRKAGVTAGTRNVVFELLPWPPPDAGGG